MSQSSHNENYKEKAKLRQSYDILSQKIFDSDLDNEGSKEKIKVLDSTLTCMDELFHKVGRSGDGREFCSDASILHGAGKLLLSEMISMNQSAADKKFNVSLFSKKLTTFAEDGVLKANETYTGPSLNPLMQIKYDKLEIDYDYVKDDEDNGIHTWAFIGRSLGRVLKKPPSMTMLRPVLKLNNIQPSAAKPKKERVKRAPAVKEERVVMKHKEKSEHCQEEVKVANEIDMVSRCFRRCVKRLKSDRICYYSFCIDPNDFAKTIENMFYVSFMIKDGRCKLSKSKEGLPVLIKLTEEERMEKKRRTVSSQTTHQSVLKFSFSHWERMKKSLNLTSALICPENGKKDE